MLHSSLDLPILARKVFTILYVFCVYWGDWGVLVRNILLGIIYLFMGGWMDGWMVIVGLSRVERREEKSRVGFIFCRMWVRGCFGI